MDTSVWLFGISLLALGLVALLALMRFCFDEEECLANYLSLHSFGSWLASPEGNRIAYVREEGITRTICIASLDGRVESTLPVRESGMESGILLFFRWLQDGSILYGAEQENFQYSWWKVQVPSGEERSAWGEGFLSGDSLDLSPNEREVVWVEEDEEGIKQLCLMDERSQGVRSSAEFAVSCQCGW